MRKISGILILACAVICGLPGGLQAQVDVWPGDATNNGEANNIDLLYMGYGFGAAGPARDSTFQSSAWAAQTANTLWGQTTNGGLNYTYFDANGDGFIDTSDVAALNANYGLTWQSPTTDPTSLTGSTSAPLLTVDFGVQTVTLPGGSTVLTANVMLGDSANPVDSIFGIAFTIEFDSVAIDSIDFRPVPSWMINPLFGGTFLSMAKVDLFNNRIEVGISRVGLQNAAGFGQIGSIDIVMDDNLKRAGGVNTSIRVTEVYAITRNESPVGLRVGGDTLSVLLGTSDPEQGRVLVYPNPASEQIFLTSEGAFQTAQVEIRDLYGRLLISDVWDQAHEKRLDLHGLAAGTYLLRLHRGDEVLTRKIILRP